MFELRFSELSAEILYTLAGVDARILLVCPRFMPRSQPPQEVRHDWSHWSCHHLVFAVDVFRFDTPRVSRVKILLMVGDGPKRFMNARRD